MAIIKPFIDDLIRLSRFQFACKYVFPSIAFFFSWGALGNFYTLTLSQRDLIANNGQVTSMGVRLESGATQYQQIKYYPIKISLRNSSKDFRIRDNFKSYFKGIQDNIQYGDTVTVYTRSKFDALISWGEEGDIYQIEKKGVVLFPLAIVKSYNTRQALVLCVFALVFWTLSVVFRLRRK